jgi:hypothetical protein
MFSRVGIHIIITEKSYSLAEKYNSDMWIAKSAFLSDIFNH